MTFSAYHGPSAGVATWTRAIRSFGESIARLPVFETQPLSHDWMLACAWLVLPEANFRPVVERHPEHFVCSTSGEVPDADSYALVRTDMSGMSGVSAGGNQIVVSASLLSGSITIGVPPTHPEHIFYSTQSSALYFGNDLRAIPCPGGRTLDECGVFSLLQYGAIVPPFTLFERVSRVPPGYRLEATPTAGGHMVMPSPSYADSVHTGDIDDPGREILKVLDQNLLGVPRETLLFFSGGVDSALLASRALEVGREDIRLVNLAFGDDDLEGTHALRMAAALGMPCNQVKATSADFIAVLDRIGRDYWFPFGDLSVLPTNVLLHTVTQSAAMPGAVLDGTGADGAFGVGMKYTSWRRVYASPSIARQAMSGAYNAFQLWRAGRPAARLARVCRRSVQMSLYESAVMALNSFDGIAYAIPSGVREAIGAASRRYLEGFSAGLCAEERMSLLDLMFVCAGRYASKSSSPLIAQGIKPVYPFLEPTMIRLSSSLSWEQKCPRGEAKGVLKSLLANRVPQDLVYRAKSGFAPPHENIFALPAMQSYLQDVVLSSQNQLRNYVNLPMIRTMVNRARRPGVLSLEACEFLWTLAFASGWLHTAPSLAMHPAEM